MNGGVRACAIVAALASGVGAAACDGGSGGSSGSNDDIENACDLLTTNEVTAFMGTREWRSKDYVGEEQGNPDYSYFFIKGTADVPFLELRVGERTMAAGVSGNDLHPVSDDEAKRPERAAGDLIVDRLQN